MWKTDYAYILLANMTWQRYNNVTINCFAWHLRNGQQAKKNKTASTGFEFSCCHWGVMHLVWPRSPLHYPGNSMNCQIGRLLRHQQSAWNRCDHDTRETAQPCHTHTHTHTHTPIHTYSLKCRIVDVYIHLFAPSHQESITKCSMATFVIKSHCTGDSWSVHVG